MKLSKRENSEIILVLPSFDKLGAQRVAIDYADKLDQLGFKVVILASKINSAMPNFEIKHKYINVGPSLLFRFKILRILENFIRIYLILRSRTNIRLILSVTPFLNRYLCFLKGLKLINKDIFIEDHAYPPLSNKDEFSFLARFFYERTCFLYNQANKLRVLSEKCKSYYLSQGISREKIIPMPNFIDFNRIVEKSTNDAYLDEFLSKEYITYIGRFESQKNISFLINAFSLIFKKCKTNLVIIGYGSQKEDLQKLVIQKKLEKRVIFLDSSYLNYKILKGSLLFPMCSLWEGMALTIIEAMVLEVPVLLTNFETNTKQFIGNDERGFIIDKSDINGFANKMLYIIENKNSEEIILKIKAAKKFVWDNIEINKMFPKYLEGFLGINEN